MRLVDAIEQYGALVDSGVMDRSDAARQLSEGSSGGLTVVGADEAISRWQTIRAEYRRIADDTRAGIKRCNDQINGAA